MNKLLAHAAFAVSSIVSSAAMAGDKTITLAVNNMDCAACPSIVKGSLEAVPGVTKVAVSFKDKTATVIYDDAKASVTNLHRRPPRPGIRPHPRANPMLLQSTITCPHCAVAKTEIMPTDACQFFYGCTGCGTKLKPKSGDCCVFCSYGSVPCPPIQAVRSGEPGATSCLCVTDDDQRTDPNLARLAWQCTHQLAGVVDA
jgi:mercuric transport protein